MSQIILLFDLDQCLPLTNDGLTAENLEALIAHLRKVCLQVLLSHSSIETASYSLAEEPNKNSINKNPKLASCHLGHFSFRFYSSNGYFMVPDQFQPRFFEVGEETLDNLEASLSERFERLIQDSKTNTYNADGLRQHIESDSHKPHSQTLRKALEEIAVLYNWDNPMLHSPVKRVRGSSRGRIPSCSTKDQNIVYVFTCLPNNNFDLAKFLGKNPRHNKRFKHQDIYDEIFNQSPNQGPNHVTSTSKKSVILTCFKNQDNPIRLSVIDTASLYEKRGISSEPVKKSVNFDKSVKHSFEKCFRQFNGSIISISCFDSELLESKRISDGQLWNNTRHSVPASSIFETYLQDSKDHSRRASIEIGKKENMCKLLLNGLANENADKDLELFLQWSLLDKGLFKQTLTVDKSTSTDLSPEDILTKQDLEFLACMNCDIIPRTQKWRCHYSVWPKISENPSKNMVISHFIFRYLAGNDKILLLRLKGDFEPYTARVCVLFPFDINSGILSVVDENDCINYSTLTTSANSIEPTAELADEMSSVIEEKLLLCSDMFPAPKGKSDKRTYTSASQFHANCFEPWKLPETSTFSRIVRKIKDNRNERKEKRFRNLQKFCLPQNMKYGSEKDHKPLAKTGFYINEYKDKLLEKRLTQRLMNRNTNKSLSRLVSDESGITIGSKGSGSNNVSEPISGKSLSRAGKMVELVQKNEQLRKNSNDDKSLVCNDSEQGPDIKDNFMRNKEETMKILDEIIKPIYDKLNPTSENDDNPLVSKLLRLQWEHIQKAEDLSLVCLAEITVRYLANFVRNKRLAQKDAAVEDILAKHFLLSPADMSNSSTRSKLWDQFEGCRIRDHKLQVLYRVDVHYILSSQKISNQIENEILDHLRKIQLWGSVKEMALFLNDVITPNYMNNSFELLTNLYDEQHQKRPKELELLFSPAKSDISSVAPSSVLSRTSELSYKSIPSLRARWCNGPNSGTVPNVSDIDKVKKLRRYTSFDTQTLQINMMDKKTLGRAAQMSVAGYNKGKNSSQGIDNIKRRTGRTPKKVASQHQSQSARAKRNLSFDEPTLARNSNSYINGLRRSPRKRISTCEATNVSEMPAKEIRTPKKAQSRGVTTPCKMTPGKSHMLYAPETPKNKSHTRRKTDGVAFVAESPDIDKIKCKTGNTPRRIAASLNLRKKTSFYSGDVSRNLMKAEELINASQIQSFTNASFHKIENSRKNNSFVQSDKDDLISKRDSCGVLFPHLVQSNTQSGKNSCQSQVEQINADKVDGRDLDQNDSGTDNRISSLRKDSGCPSDKLSNIGSTASFASRKLFHENIPNSEIDKTSPIPSYKREMRKVALTPVAVSKNRLFTEEDVHPAFIEGLEEFRSPRKKISVLQDHKPTSNEAETKENLATPEKIPNDPKDELQNNIDPKTLLISPEIDPLFPLANAQLSDKSNHKIVESIANSLCQAAAEMKADQINLTSKPVSSKFASEPFGKLKEPIELLKPVSIEVSKIALSSDQNISSKSSINRSGKVEVDLDMKCERAPVDKQIDNVCVEDTKCDKPSRKRKLTSRLGIDDITLNEAIHSTSPKIRVTPKIRRSEVILKNIDLSAKQPLMQVTAADDAPIICDKTSSEKPPKRRKLSKQFELEHIKDNDDSCCKKFNGSSCGYHEGMNELSDSKLISKRVVIELKKHDTDVNLEESKIVPCNKSPDITSPDKIWSVASRTESPKGEIKLCINRKKKSLVSSCINPI